MNGNLVVGTAGRQWEGNFIFQRNYRAICRLFRIKFTVMRLITVLRHWSQQQNDTTLRLNDFEQRYLLQQKTGKTGGHL